MPMVPSSETFFVDESGYLCVCRVTKGGSEYQHRCSRHIFEEVAHAIDELAHVPFTGETIRRAVLAQIDDAPWTPVMTAIAFLKERSIIRPTTGRLHVANSEAVHLDAMTEYHALREIAGSGG